MRNEEEEHQAEKLQQLFEEVNNQTVHKESKPIVEEDYIEVDVLNLPPRKEVHTNPKSRWNITIKRPFIRISFVLILLIAILFTIYYFMGDQLLQMF